MSQHITPHPLDGTTREMQAEMLDDLMQTHSISREQAKALLNLAASAAEVKQAGVPEKVFNLAIMSIMVRVGGGAA